MTDYMWLLIKQLFLFENLCCDVQLIECGKDAGIPISISLQEIWAWKFFFLQGFEMVQNFCLT